MKHRYKNLKFWHNTIGLLLFLTWSTGLWGQQNVFWRTEAANGNWENGDCGDMGTANSQWWYAGFTPNNARNRPDCNDGSTTRHNLEIDNNHQTTMTLNTTFWGIRSLTLTSGTTANRTFNGSPDDGTRGIGLTNGIYNNANNGVAHNFNVRIGIDAANVTLRTSTNGATTNYNREIFGNSNTITFNGSGTTNITDRISGSGCSVVKSESGTLTLTGQNTYTGTTTISAGTLQLNRTGGTTIPNTNSVTVSGGTLRVSQNQTLSNLTLSSGGLTIDSGATLTLTGNVTIPNDFTITNNGTLVIEGTLTDNRTTKSFGGTVRYAASSGSQSVVDGSYTNLELAGASTKTFNGDIAISGNFTVSGGIVTPPSMVTFNGSSAQNIAGLDYNNIEFSNGGANAKIFTSNASVSPTSAITFTGSPGTVDFDGPDSSNFDFVLQSTALGTARVGNATGWVLNGRVRAERYIPAKRAWRLLTAPLKGNTNDKISNNWQGTTNEGLLLFSPATFQSQSMIGYAPGGSSPNIWRYNNAWQLIPNLTEEPLFSSVRNNAFLVFATGPHGSSNITSGQTETTLKPKGQLLTGDSQGNVTINGLTTGQYHLIGNPFASPINTVALRGLNNSFTFWLLDPTLGSFGGYYTFNGTNWTPIAPNVNAGQPENLNIQSGQGFFVRSETETTFTFNESHKETGNSNTWFEKQSVQNTSENKIRVLLDRQINSQWQLVDGILSVSGSTYANELDAQDALKVTNFNENIQFHNGTTNLAIEYLNLPTMATEQPIRLTGTTATSYRLRVRTEGFASLDVQPILQDTQSGTNHLIPTDGSTIEIPFTGVVSTTSTPDNRFKIVYQQVLGVEQPINNTLQVYPNPVTEDQFVIALPNSSEVATYEITNYLGQVVQKGNLTAGNTNVSIASQAVGVYLVRVQQNGLVYTTKIVKK